MEQPRRCQIRLCQRRKFLVEEVKVAFNQYPMEDDEEDDEEGEENEEEEDEDEDEDDEEDEEGVEEDDVVEVTVETGVEETILFGTYVTDKLPVSVVSKSRMLLVTV